MASSGVMMMSPLSVENGLSSSKLIVKAGGGKKITTNKPYAINWSTANPQMEFKSALVLTYQARISWKIKKKKKTERGINGDLKLQDGVDASGRRAKGKGVYQFVKKYGANVDGYSPIYNPDEWSPSGDVYVGGTTGLALWAVTLAGLLAGGALLIYNTSALSQ